MGRTELVAPRELCDVPRLLIDTKTAFLEVLNPQQLHLLYATHTCALYLSNSSGSVIDRVAFPKRP